MLWSEVYTRTQENYLLDELQRELHTLIAFLKQNGITKEVQIGGPWGEVTDKLVLRNGVFAERFYLYEEDDRTLHGGTFRYETIPEDAERRVLYNYRIELGTLKAIIQSFASPSSSLSSGSNAAQAASGELRRLVASKERDDLVRSIEMARIGEKSITLTSRGLEEVAKKERRLVPPEEFFIVARNYKLTGDQVKSVLKKISS